MNKVFFSLIIIGVLFSCNSNDNNNLNTELIGDWKLIEILSDPGDGSGVFNSVDSEKIITFKNEGTITSNGILCDMSTNTNNPSSGTYSSSAFTFKSSDCNDSDYNYVFKQTENILIIYFPCIEPCQAKYIKQE